MNAVVHHPRRTLHEINALNLTQFTAAFGDVLDDAPHLAAVAWDHRPFVDAEDLARAFAAAMDTLDEEGALALLRAHPTLGAPGATAPASVGGRTGAGLRGPEARRLDALAAGRAAYLHRFGFPFIVAVDDLTPEGVDAALAERLTHTTDQELLTALAQVRRIAALRIADRVTR